MYASHFGLSKRLFPGKPHGSDVFVGPQTATVMSALNKALAAEDAVIVVSGPVGVGKTTIVRRALEAIGVNRLVIMIGRMHLGYDEVIELLLAGLGARKLPKSMVQRFAMFRRLLQQYSDKGTRIFIVVEDAIRIGLDALSELEALTAEDSGASAGASLVLMGSEGTAELLRKPELVRLKQRVRLRQEVKPLTAGELRGYLKHCFRVAGGDFDAAFGPGCSEALHRLSDGTPRLANNIIEQALNTGAEQGLDSLSVSFVERVAAEEIGLTAEHSVADIQDALKQSADDANSLEASSAQLRQCPQEAIDLETPETTEHAESYAAILPPDESGRVVQEPVEAMTTAEATANAENHAEILAPATNDPEDPEPVEAAMAAETTAEFASAADAEPTDESTLEIVIAATPDDDGIPILIQDTLPDLEVLGTEIAIADTARTELEGLFADEDRDLKTLSSSQRLVLPLPAARLTEPEPPPPETDATAGASGRDDSNNDEVPAWERDPTLAELRPDLEALERAMSVAQGADDDVEPKQAAVADKEDIPELVPEITLDREIQAKIDEATEALRQTQVEQEPDQANSEDQSLEASLAPSENVEAIRRPAEEPAAAVSQEQPKAAAASEANKPPIPRHAKDTGQLKRAASGPAEARTLGGADDRMAETLFGKEFTMAAAEIAASVAASTPANDELQPVDNASRAGSSDSSGKSENTNLQGLSRPSQRPASDKAILDTEAAERLATVRALNNGAAPAGTPPSLSRGESIVMAEGTSSGRPRKPEEMPSSIEDQINSATQTLKTLRIPPSALADNDDEESPKGGFFSCFKRS